MEISFTLKPRDKSMILNLDRMFKKFDKLFKQG